MQPGIFICSAYEWCSAVFQIDGCPYFSQLVKYFDAKMTVLFSASETIRQLPCKTHDNDGHSTAQLSRWSFYFTFYIHIIRTVKVSTIIYKYFPYPKKKGKQIQYLHKIIVKWMMEISACMIHWKLLIFVYHQSSKHSMEYETVKKKSYPCTIIYIYITYVYVPPTIVVLYPTHYIRSSGNR